MKNSFIAQGATLALLLFVLAPAYVHAQVKMTLYYTKSWQLTKKDSAKYIRTATYDTLNYNFNGPVEDRYAYGYAKGELEMSGNYVDGLKEGPFIFYYENGRVESTGLFESNSRSGLWKYYYLNGFPKSELEFTPVFGNEPTILFLNDSLRKQILHNGNGKWFEIVDLPTGGQLTVHGQYKNNEKHGKWTVRTRPAKTIVVETFNKGRFVNGYVKSGGDGMELYEPQEYAHLLPDKFRITEAFNARPDINFNVYPQLKYMLRGPEPVVNYIWDEGDPVFTKPEIAAQPPGGLDEMYRILDATMEYPEEAKVMGIQGKVYVEFIVDKGGNLRRFKVVKGIGGGCDEEAVRILEEYANKYQWTPAAIQGRRVKQLFLLSLQFQLGS